MSVRDIDEIFFSDGCLYYTLARLDNKYNKRRLIYSDDSKQIIKKIILVFRRLIRMKRRVGASRHF